MESVDKFWCRRNNPSAILKKAVIAFHNDVDVDGSVDGQDDDDHDDDDDDVGNDDFLFFGRKTQNAPIEERSRKQSHQQRKDFRSSLFISVKVGEIFFDHTRRTSLRAQTPKNIRTTFSVSLKNSCSQS